MHLELCVVSFATLRAMQSFPVERKMCLQNRALPLVTREMEFEDIHSVGARDLGTENFECLPLRTSMEAPWLSKFFKKPAKWWLHNGSKVPLVREIRETIETGKVRKGGASRLSKRADIVVAINVRGKVILVQNTTLPVTLCWPTNTDDGDEGIEVVKWFLEEFSCLLQAKKPGFPSNPLKS